MTVCFAKADRKLHSGRFTYRGFGADVNTFRLNAYGGGERDTRKAASSILGLTVMPHDGQRIDPVATEEREVIPGEVAITKRRLSRGKLAKIRNAAVSGKSLASDEDPILCREGSDGKLVAVRGAHRIAVATMEGMPRTLKVRVAKNMAAQDLVTQETGLAIPEPTSLDRRRRIAALRKKRRAENNK